ncbi:MAG TPA: hypothetical protein VMG12_20350 [Polyangiaceae bacterium]|nr:hypothetical protein [Polyangiaceae bacterium]
MRLASRSGAFFVFGLLAVGLFGAGCDDTRSCSDILCIDETALVIERPDGVWADGDYVLELRLDQQRYECAFTLPIAGKLPHELQLAGEPIDCTPALPARGISRPVALYPTPDESESCGGVDSGQQPPAASCPPLAGRYHIEVHTSATSDELGVRLTSGARVLLDRTTTVDYRVSEPAGAGCGECSSAQLSYSIDEPD